MGLTKTDRYTKSQIKLAALAKVIGHPARLAILQHLLKVNTCICGDLVDEIGLAQATISQHLRELKKVGLIQGNIEGTSVCYCIHPEIYNQARELFANLFGQQLPYRKDCC